MKLKPANKITIVPEANLADRIKKMTHRSEKRASVNIQEISTHDDKEHNNN